MNRTGEQWPTLNTGRNKPVTEIRESWIKPNSKIMLKGFSLFMFDTIPELLEQARMVEAAKLKPDTKCNFSDHGYTYRGWKKYFSENETSGYFFRINPQNPKGDINAE